MNKYEELSNWLTEYQPLGDWIYFNVTNIEEGSTSLNSMSSPKYLNKFIDGSTECELNFSIDLIKSYDTGTSTTNLEAIEECHQLINWCNKQNNLGILPDFGKGFIVNQVDILDNTPELSIDPENMLAKYQILGKVNYLDLKGEN